MTSICAIADRSRMTLVLYRNLRHGNLPLRYVRILNEANERLLRIRHGGSYEFLHVTLRDYMAGAHGPKAAMHETELKSGIGHAS